MFINMSFECDMARLFLEMSMCYKAYDMYKHKSLFYFYLEHRSTNIFPWRAKTEM